MSYITGRAINAQVGTSYTVLDSDRDRLVTYSNSSAVAVTLPQASTPAGQFGPGWTSYHQNIGTGTVTITPTTSTINGFTSITLFQWETATITSDGTNYKTMINPLASTDNAANLSTYLANDAGTGAARNQLIVRNINTGVNSQRKGMNIYLEHDGASSAANYDSLQVNHGFTVDAFTSKTQGQSDGAEILLYGAMMNATFTSVANASGGNTVYTGTIENGANNGAVGLSFIVTGFTNGANNGTFQAVASTATTLTLNNAAGVAETHAGAAVVASTFTLTSVATSIGSSAVYTGTIPGGGSNYYAGWQFRILGFTTAANNGLFVCTASSTTTLTLTTSVAVAETHAATAAWYTIGELNTLKLRWGNTQNANALNNTAILQYLPEIATNCTLENFSGFSIDAAAGGGSIINFTGVNAGSSLNGLAFCQTEIGLTAAGSSNPSVNGYGILAVGKTASILVSDATVASSFIGHANFTPTITGSYTLHDGWYAGTGSPEGVVTAAVGSMWSQQNGTQSTSFYVKTNGSSNTGWGAVVPNIIAGQVNLITQSASIGTTTLYAVPNNGMFRLSYYMKVTQAATTSSSVQLTLTYTDRDDSTVLSFLTASPLNATDETGVISDSIVIDAKAATNIQYATTYASTGGTSMQYKLRIRLEAI